MSDTRLSHSLVAALVKVIETGTAESSALATISGPQALVLDAIRRRLATSLVAARALQNFLEHPTDAVCQVELEHGIALCIPAAEIGYLIGTLQSDQPIAQEEAQHLFELMTDQALETLKAEQADYEPLDTIHSDDQSVSVIASPIPVIEPGASTPALRNRGPLPTQLSSDGIHFSFGHALIIGVGHYRNPGLPTVATTANDARALASVLRDPQLAGYPPSQVRVLVDAKATRANILDALEELAYRAAGGTALVAFIGHGEHTEDGYALLPTDAELEQLAATAITAELFQQRIAKIRASARRLVVLLNCCHTGEIAPGPLDAKIVGAVPPAEFYRPLAVSNDQVVIISARPGQKASPVAQRVQRHTTFGVQLLAGLRGAAPQTQSLTQQVGAAVIGAHELFAYLRAAVPPDARRTFYQRRPLVQEPLFYTGQPGEDFPLALRPIGAGLGSGQEVVARLVALELEFATTGNAVPPEQLAERDALLTRISGPQTRH